MAKYIISPSSIAACCNVIDPAGVELNYIYLAPDKLPSATPLTQRVMPFENLPLAIRAAVNRHFGIVFALPLEKRGAYMNQCTNWEIETNPPCPFCHSTLGDDSSGDYPRCLNCGAA